MKKKKKEKKTKGEIPQELADWYVEQEAYFRSIKVLRRMSYVTEDQKKKILGRIMKRMLDIPHLRSFIQDRGEVYARNFVSDTIDAFYGAIDHSGKDTFN